MTSRMLSQALRGRDAYHRRPEGDAAGWLPPGLELCASSGSDSRVAMIALPVKSQLSRFVGRSCALNRAFSFPS